MSAERRWGSTDVLWLGLVSMIVLCLAFLLPVRPQDYWWYVRLGRDILQTGAVPAVDTFTLAQPNHPIVYQSWLSAGLFWAFYQAGGITLAVLARGLVLALAYGLGYALMRESGAGPRTAALVTFAAVLAGSNNWSMRPQFFAYPLFLACCWILRRWSEGDRRAIWLLPAVSLLWVNLHGSFVLLFVLGAVALVLGRGDRRNLAMALTASLLVTVLNPRGPIAWQYVVTSLSIPSNQLYSREWSPPVNLGWQMNLFFAWLLVFAPLVAFSPRKLSRLDWGWFLGFGWLALSGERYVVWLVFLLAIFTAELIAEWGKRVLDRARGSIPILDVGLGILLIVLPVFLLPGVRQTWWTQGPPALSSAETPEAATRWLAAHPELPGPLWSEIGFASYLIFALPDRPVWMYTLFELFPVDQWEQYKAVNNARYDWQGILDLDGINLMMISVTGQPDLASALAGSPAWCQRYIDETAVIYQRCSTEGE